MKRLLTLIILGLTTNTFGQVEAISTEVEETYYYYKKAFSSISDASSYMSDCDGSEDIDDLQSYASSAESELDDARRYISNAVDEASDIQSQASDLSCDDAYSYGSNAESYFDDAEREIKKAISELSSASYEDDMETLKSYVSDAEYYVRKANSELSGAVDELNNVLSSSNNCVAKVDLTSTYGISCNDLLETIEEHGYDEGSLSSFSMGSQWLQTVTAYDYDGTTYVVATIKDNQYSYDARTYIWCDIPSMNWYYFKNGGYGDSDSYGERFHKYIYDHKCDCY